MINSRIGIIFSFMFFQIIDASSHRIALYYQYIDCMEKQLQVVQNSIGKKSELPAQSTAGHDHATAMVQASSDLMYKCINTTCLPKSADATTKAHAFSQVVMAVYAILQRCSLIIQYKKNRVLQIEQMQYDEVLAVYPQLFFIEYQIKIMKLLVEMLHDGSVPEKIFSAIHLASMYIPGPYERYTQKQAKKLFKSLFSTDYELLRCDDVKKEIPYHNFGSKVSSNWRNLALRASEFPTHFVLLFTTQYRDVLLHPKNQCLIAMIRAAAFENDIQKMIAESRGFAQDVLVQQVINFYTQVS